jgi:hypothetical protein
MNESADHSDTQSSFSFKPRFHQPPELRKDDSPEVDVSSFLVAGKSSVPPVNLSEENLTGRFPSNISDEKD